METVQRDASARLVAPTASQNPADGKDVCQSNWTGFSEASTVASPALDALKFQGDFDDDFHTDPFAEDDDGIAWNVAEDGPIAFEHVTKGNMKVTVHIEGETVEQDGMTWEVVRGTPPAMEQLEDYLEEVKALYKSTFGHSVDDSIPWNVSLGEPHPVDVFEDQSPYKAKYNSDVDGDGIDEGGRCSANTDVDGDSIDEGSGASMTASEDVASVDSMETRWTENELALYKVSLSDGSVLSSLEIRSERLKVAKKLSDIRGLMQRANGRKKLNDEQQAKIQKKQPLEARMAELRVAEEKCIAQKAPNGLSLASVDPARAAKALKEVQPHFRRDGASLGAVEELEVGWSFRVEKHGRPTPGKPWSQFPELRALLTDAMAQVDGVLPTPDLFARLNVICRRYRPGDGLNPHKDREDLFGDVVYGCVLENTSDRVLEFWHEAGPKYRIPEKPGACFKQQSDARYSWVHGVDTLSRGERVSVTWRCFSEKGHGGASQ